MDVKEELSTPASLKEHTSDILKHGENLKARENYEKSVNKPKGNEEISSENDDKPSQKIEIENGKTPESRNEKKSSLKKSDEKNNKNKNKKSTTDIKEAADFATIPEQKGEKEKINRPEKKLNGEQCIKQGIQGKSVTPTKTTISAPTFSNSSDENDEESEDEDEDYVDPMAQLLMAFTGRKEKSTSKKSSPFYLSQEPKLVEKPKEKEDTDKKFILLAIVDETGEDISNESCITKSDKKESDHLSPDQNVTVTKTLKQPKTSSEVEGDATIVQKKKPQAKRFEKHDVVGTIITEEDESEEKYEKIKGAPLCILDDEKTPLELYLEDCNSNSEALGIKTVGQKTCPMQFG